MEPYLLPVFDSWYDGNMSIAKRLVNIYRTSHKFTLLDYPGKDEFYMDSLTKFDEYEAQLFDIAI